MTILAAPTMDNDGVGRNPLCRAAQLVSPKRAARRRFGEAGSHPCASGRRGRVCRQLAPDAGADDVIEFGKRLQKVGVTTLEYGILLASANPARAFAVSGVERFGDVHALDHAGEGDELLVVSLAVVAQVDERLGRAAVGILEGKRDRP